MTVIDYFDGFKTGILSAEYDNSRPVGEAFFIVIEGSRIWWPCVRCGLRNEKPEPGFYPSPLKCDRCGHPTFETFWIPNKE